jgi:predicted AlkP superfamily pyrophosphatase or phosphodiesterase
VSIDGLRPDAIDRFAAANLQRIAREGWHTYRARTILPSKTLPSHTSMLTGVGPAQHGVDWNSPITAEADTLSVPTIFGIARSRGFVTAAFFSKSKFHLLQAEDTVDYTQAPGGWFGRWGADRTIGGVEAYLRRARPNLLFVHLGEPDRAGHRDGWMTPGYGRAVQAADAAVARLLDAATAAFGAGRFTAIVTADHGGHGRDHGSDDVRDVTIPWIAWGEGVRPGRAADSDEVVTMDTASTALWLLGIDSPAGWAGSPVAAAFLDAPVRTRASRRGSAGARAGS